MNIRTIILLLISLTLCFASVGQYCPIVPTKPVPFLFKYEINATNDTSFYNKAHRLVKINEHDSLFEACVILNRLNQYNSVKYSKDFLASDLLKIEESNSNYLNTNIIGIWKLYWSGRNWGMSYNIPSSKNAKVIFTDTTATFYIGGKLVRKTKYIIANEFVSPYIKEVRFQLYFVDNKNIWDFAFMSKGVKRNAKFNPDGLNFGLYINERPDCLRDCPERVYLKVFR